MKSKVQICILVIISLAANLFIGIGSPVYADNTAPAAYYKFDGDTKDSSGNGNDGVVTIGNITYIEGPLGKAAVFDGKSYIEVNDSASLDLGKEFTFSVWVNHEPIPNLEYQGIMTKLKNDWDGDFAYGLGLTNLSPYADRYDADYQNIGKNGRNAEKRLEAHKWQLLTITYDGSVYKFFYNGELAAQKESYNGTTVIASSGKLQIGMDPTKSAFYKGRLDDLRIYNRLLSQQEIKNLYGEVISGPGKELADRPDRMIAYFSFNEGAKDGSGFANDGAVLGNITYVDSIASKGARFTENSYIEVKDSDSLEIDKGFTVSGWFKLDAVKPGPFYIYPIIEKHEGSINLSEHAYWMGVINNPKLSPWFKAFCFSNGDPVINTQLGAMAESNMKPGVWGMLTQTFNGKEAKIYFDGKLIHTQTMEVQDTIIHSKGKLVIGKMLLDDKHIYAKGIFDELRLYNYALEEAAVKKLCTLKDVITINLPEGKTEVALKAKGTYQLTPKVQKYVFTAAPSVPGTGTDSYVPTNGLKFTYKSLNPKVAKVDDKGKITAIAKGKTTIQINNGEVTGFLAVKVD